MNLTHFLFGINDFGLQVCGDDPPPGGAERVRLAFKTEVTVFFYCLNISPLVGAQQDHVLSTEAQSSSGLLYGIVALWGHRRSLYRSTSLRLIHQSKLYRQACGTAALCARVCVCVCVTYMFRCE